jgi:hypothetical protein
MLIAKVVALVGLVLFLGGAIGALVVTSLAAGAVLLLAAATVGAIALEGRDLQAAAGLAPDEEPDAPAIGSAVPAVRRAA